jgi:hypothetical protein
MMMLELARTIQADKERAIAKRGRLFGRGRQVPRSDALALGEPLEDGVTHAPRRTRSIQPSAT